jgi:hypothetical protein
MMKARNLATRVAVFGSVLIGFGALAASPALAVASPTVTTLESSQNPSPACGTVTFKATVFGAVWPDSPLGGVQFFDGGSTLGSPQIITWDFDTFLGAHVVPTDHSSASITVPLSGGTHIITVQYAGLDLPSAGGPLTQTVTAATSTTAVTSTVNPSVYGQPVTFNAGVSSSCSGNVAGSVQFRADGADLGDPQTVDSSGPASISPASLSVGNHPVTALFTSSNSDVTGSSGSLSGGQTVNAADTTTTVFSSNDPSEYGAAVTFTATTAVSSPGAGTASGSIQFRDNGTNLGLPQNLGSGGQAWITTASLGVGSHTITASFTSDSANFNDSSTSTNQVVNEARTSLTYTGATNADYHDTAVLSARLTRSDNSAPISGKTIILTIGSESCSQTTGANGDASCSLTPQDTPGSFTATSSFADDGNYLSSSDSRSFTVTTEETTLTYNGPTVVLAGSSGATLSAHLVEDGTNDNDGDAGSTAPAPSGQTITFTLGGQTCSAVANASGDASCTIAAVSGSTLGPNTIGTSFTGDSHYAGSADSDPVIVFAFPSRGAFVLGDRTVIAATTTTNVNWWNDAWWQLDSLSGGVAPLAFKGFGQTISTLPTTSPASTCGATFTTAPGNSPPPTTGVPSYMGVLVAGSTTKTGSNVNGTWNKIVVVQTNPGYSPSPGHPGTGRIVATFCG